ncbi:MAG: hypothetical protein ACKOW1_07335 [Novosphingobium sp.]|jgi:hypothetical protein
MFTENLMIAASLLLTTTVIAAATLKGWQGWLSLKLRELEAQRTGPDTGNSSGMARIEIADLKERIRKLEAIAAGVDL